MAALGGDEKVRVLDALGDALARQHLADVVERDKGSGLVIGNIGVYSHQFFAVSLDCSRRPAGLSAWLACLPGWLVCPAGLSARLACLLGAARIQSGQRRAPPSTVTLAKA